MYFVHFGQAFFCEDTLPGLSERHCMQEIVRPDVFWYEAALKSPMPFGNSPAAILGLVAFELFAMHYVEVRRAYDLKNPGSVDQDPIFKNYR
jgi:light-harvesting complex I chlorophyll a/b binding protein 4